jgi:hypothetical protein
VIVPSWTSPFHALRAATIAVGLVAAACGSPSASDPDSDSDGKSKTDPKNQEIAPGTFSTDTGIAPPPAAAVYGHSATTLFKVDPDTKLTSIVGSLAGCGDIIDIAIDADSQLFAASFDAFYKVEKGTGACTLVGAGKFPNSMSFVPKGTLDPNQEVLVGYKEGDYVRIDTATGTTTTVGALGGGFTSSGDIVSVKDGATFLTVKGPGCNDCLVEVSPKTGGIVKNWGPINHPDVYGLAFWAGQVYGFDNSGDVFYVTFEGTGIRTTDIQFPQRPDGLRFWGAGSTTLAPPTRVK